MISMCQYNREENKWLGKPVNTPCSFEEPYPPFGRRYTLKNNEKHICKPETVAACKAAEENLKIPLRKRFSKYNRNQELRLKLEE